MSVPHAEGLCADNAVAAHVLAARLLAGGNGHVVISPGSRSTPLALACDRLARERLHVVLDERAAAFVALGLGRATGLPAVLLGTSGSAGGHWLPALIEAAEGRVPLIAVSADRPLELHGCGALQTTEQRALFTGHARWSSDLTPADVPASWLATVAAQACDRAVAGPAGPVHLNVRFREPLWRPEHERAFDAPPATAIVRGRAHCDERALARIATALSAKQGAIVCGPLASATVDRGALDAAVGALAAALGWPVVAEAASGVRAGRVAHAQALLHGERFAATHTPAVALRIGATPTSKATLRWLAAARLIAVDADGWLCDPSARTEEIVAADVAATLSALAERVGRCERAWLERWRAADACAGDAIARACGAGAWEGAIARALSQALPAGGQLFVASSLAIRALDAFGAGNFEVHANRGVSGIDGAIATATGLALAQPGRPTAAYLGDLAFLHDLDGLEAAVQSGAALALVVADNRGGGIFDTLPIAAHDAFERLFVTPRGADVGAVARALGARHQRLESPAELAHALSDASSGGVAVLELPIDRDESRRRHRAAWRAVADSLHEQERNLRP